MIEFNGDTAESIGDIMVMQNLMKVAVHRSEGGDNLLFCTKLLDLLFQFFFLFLKALIIFVCLADELEHVIQSERCIRRDFICVWEIAYKLGRFIQNVPVRVDLHERSQIVYGFKLGQCGFKLYLIS